MTALGPIVAPTDFSALARHAMDRAARLAHETGAPLTLVHVLPGGMLQDLRRWLGGDHAAETYLHDEVERQMRQLADELKIRRQVTARTVHSIGSVVDDVLAEASAQDAALIVLGARGAGFMRRVLGGTAERLLRCTTRALLVVRHKPHEPYRRVLVALDFSPWSARAVALARRVAPRAQLVLFNACQVPFEEKLRFAGMAPDTIEAYRRQARSEALARVHALAEAIGLNPLDWEPCIVDGDAALRILEQVQERDCGLVVLGKHGQSATEDLLLGSVSKQVLTDGSTDVLVSTGREGIGA